MSKRTDHLNMILIFMCPAALAVWLSLHVVWLGDDLDYMFRMQGAIWQSWGWIRTPGEFLDSQITHYMNVNGRFVAHALVQLFNGIIGQTAFAVTNGVGYAIATLLLARLGGARPLNTRSVLTAVFMLLFGFITKMMPTCQIGYVWGMAVNLLWCGLFLSGRQRRSGSMIAICIFSVIAGNWNEAYSVGIGGVLGVMLLSCWLKHPLRRLTPQGQIMAVCYILGTATVCLSPSTLSRASSMAAGTPSLAMVSPPGWLYALLSLRIFYIFVSVLAWKVLRREFKIRAFLYSESFWLTAMMFLLIFNLLLGVFGNRQLFGVEMCSAVLTMRLLKRHAFTRLWLSAGMAAVFMIFSWQYIMADKVRKQYEEIHRLFLDSTDGHIYYDRQRATSEGFTREAKIYEDIVGLYDNDPHHSLMKFFRHTDKKRRKLLIIPRSVTETGWTDTVYSYAPGHFIAIGHSGDTILLRSSVSVLGNTEYELTDRPFDFHKSIKGPRGLELIIITPSDPWQIQTTAE